MTQRSDHAQGWTHYLGQLSGGAANMGFVAALPGAVAEYIKAWDETDIAASAGQLDACWEDDAAFRDSTGVTAGRGALPHSITNAQKFVPGFALELAGRRSSAMVITVFRG